MKVEVLKGLLSGVVSAGRSKETPPVGAQRPAKAAVLNRRLVEDAPPRPQPRAHTDLGNRNGIRLMAVEDAHELGDHLRGQHHVGVDAQEVRACRFGEAQIARLGHSGRGDDHACAHPSGDGTGVIGGLYIVDDDDLMGAHGLALQAQQAGLEGSGCVQGGYHHGHGAGGPSGQTSLVLRFRLPIGAGGRDRPTAINSGNAHMGGILRVRWLNCRRAMLPPMARRQYGRWPPLWRSSRWTTMASMALPFGPPLAPMLARLQKEIPEGEEWLYEPKWDGFRALVWRDGDDVDVISRDGRPLIRYFPELPRLLGGALPERCVVDGEVLITAGGAIDFDALQLRIHPAASRVKMLAAETPASFVAFDCLALADDDLRAAPLSARRESLETVSEPAPAADIPALEALSFAVTPQTSTLNEAEAWFESFEGVVAKRATDPYLPGERAMVKVKHRRTADCVVGGYRMHKSGDGVGSLLLGLYDDSGVLHYVGHTSSFKAAERGPLRERLAPLEGGTSFGGGRAPGGPSRWNAGKDQSFVALEPVLVCEVAFDRLQSGRFRHSATLMRWRTDKPPHECTFDQVTQTA